MTQKTGQPSIPASERAYKAALRKKAEQQLAALDSLNLETLTADQTQQMLHELRVHQIELEIQNEELRRAQHELDAARERYFDLYDLAPVGYFTLSGKGLILEANLAAAEMLGEGRSALNRQLLAHFIVKEDQDVYYLHRKKLFENGDPQNCDLRFKKKDGTLFWAHLAFSAAVDREGAPLYRAVISDITGRKMAEEENRSLNEELEKRVFDRTVELETANKELESFSYSISHDLRAPLRGIDGWSLALKEEYEDKLDDKGREYIDRIRRDAVRMGKLIEALLQLSCYSRLVLNLESVNLSEIAHTILEQSEIKNSSTRVIIQPGMIAKADRNLITLALTNLLENAEKFSSKTAHPLIEFGNKTINNQSTYFIRDNGVGFDSTTAKNLFAPFQRMHHQNDFPGIGIGLSTVQRIINHHGGKVWADAEVNHGATFYFTLCGGNPV